MSAIQHRPRTAIGSPASDSSAGDPAGRSPRAVEGRGAARAREILLFILGLSMFLSMVRAMRLSIAGLVAHPLTLPLIVLALVAGMHRYRSLPTRLWAAITIYSVVFAVVTLQAGVDRLSNDIIKICFTWAVILTLAAGIRTRADSRAIAMGYTVAVSLVGARAILQPTAALQGFDPLQEGGNKNSYSLYALPAILLAGYFLLEADTPRRSRIVFGAGAALATIGILSTGNRSGYVGLVVIAVMLFARGRRLRDMAIIALLGVAIFVALTRLGSTNALLFRLSHPTTSQESDQLREDIMRESIAIGLGSPLMGVGPPAVAATIGPRLGNDSYDAHNLFGYNFAGGGFTLFAALMWLGWTLWRRPGDWPPKADTAPAARSALGLLRMVLVLMAVRGWFTEEVLTIPGFPMAIGVALGLVLVTPPIVGGKVGSRSAPTATTPSSPAQRFRHPDLFERERERRRALITRCVPVTRAR